MVKPWSVSELHRHCNTRNTEISRAAIQTLRMCSSDTELGLIHTLLKEVILKRIKIKLDF